MPDRTGTIADYGLDPSFPFLHEIEVPPEGARTWTYWVDLKGWVLVPPDAVVQGLRIEHGGRVDLVVKKRPDVEVALQGPQAVGFQQQVPVEGSVPGEPWVLVVTINGAEYRQVLSTVKVAHDANELMRALKRMKLERLEPLLRCPAYVPNASETACLGPLARDAQRLRCTRCGTTYGADARRFDFLSNELRELAAVSDTDNVSALGYDEIAEDIIRDCASGLVLDNGSGAKDYYRENIVYLEIVDYESTDVLGVGESLPFADDTFDAVLSLAVLEHVRDPFRCAAEIVRVLKPRGKVYAAVPFLQPYHGYPSHYYNMTLQGLEHLFEGPCTIDDSGTPEYGLPIWTLCWFLSRYVQGLPPEIAERFREMKIRDFVRLGNELLDRDFVTELAPDANHDLASVNYVIATKK